MPERSVSARFLEMLLWVSGAQRQAKTSEASESECKAAFAICSEAPSADLSALWMEQVGRICQNEQPTSLSRLVDSVTAQKAWPVVERRLLEMHVECMLQVFLSSTRDAQRLTIADWHFNLYHDGPPSLIPAPPSRSVFRSLLRCVRLGGDVHAHALLYLSHLSYHRMVGVLTYIIREVISNSCVDCSTIARSMMLFTPENPDVFSNIVQFLVGLSQALHLIGAAMLDAALLSILPLIAARWDPSAVYGDVYRRIHFHLGGKSRSPYRARTIELLGEIVSSGLCAVVDHPSGEGTWVDFLQPLFRELVNS
ncbi:hypothetical protein DFH09DRAFT_1121233, partial [Mycena vulgaris]